MPQADDPIPDYSIEEYHRHREEVIATLSRVVGACMPTETYAAKPVVVNGTRYPSTMEAAHATGISERAIREKCQGVKRGPRGQVNRAFTARFVR